MSHLWAKAGKWRPRKRGIVLLPLVLILGAWTPVLATAGDYRAPVPFDDSEIVSHKYPSWFKPSFLDLQDDLADAREAGKLGLVLFFASEGCAYCKAFLEHTLADADIQADLRKGFDVVGLSMFSDIEITDFSGKRLPAKALALREGATVSPTLVFYQTDGGSLLRIRGYYPPAQFRVVLDYLMGGHFETESLRAYATRRIPQRTTQQPETYTDPSFETPPYVFDRRLGPAQEPLLIAFEGGSCETCARVSKQVLAHPPVRRLLARFEAARFDWLDTDTPLVTPQGERSHPAAWAERLRITQVPTLVFFDETGEEVFRLESLALHQRMERALLYVLEKAYLRGVTYQQFTRAKSIETLASGRR